MERFSDKAVSLFQALGVHVLAALIMLLGLQASEPIQLSGGAPLEAVMVDLSTMASVPKARPAPPKPTPPTPPPPAQAKPPPPPPPPKPEPQVQQEQAALRQSQLAAEQAAAAERLRVQQAQERQKELERQQELEKIRKEREQAERQRKLEEQRLAQLRERQNAEAEQRRAAAAAVAAQQAAANAAANQADSLLNQYSALLQDVVTQSWRRPPTARPGIRCVLRVRQIPGGEVIGVSIGSPCNAAGAVQQSILEAVERASPLPYSGFERVFQRDLRFEFFYNG